MALNSNSETKFLVISTSAMGSEKMSIAFNVKNMNFVVGKKLTVI